MFRPRIIPVLLLKGKGLVKSVQFKHPRYIGDPINAVRIFNDLKADELVFLDILASNENRTISLDFVKNVGEEANMPFAIGGGIRTLEDIQAIIGAGAEKVVINTRAALNPEFIEQASDAFGSSTIVVCMDVKNGFFGREQTWILGGRKGTGLSPVEFARQMEQCGAGELIVQSIEKDGTMQGYDLSLIRQISKAVSIPVVALGGAGTLEHLRQACHQSFASGLAAGSMFVYHGDRNGILINYPERKEINDLFSSKHV
jgi:cyclase